MARRRKSEADPLTRDGILDEAVRLLQDEGLDGVSLRRLATRLGVSAPSLYWHFPDKNALLAAVCERVFGQGLDAVPAGTDWVAFLRAFGLALWAARSSLRDFGRMITTVDLPADLLARMHGRLRERLAVLDLPLAEGLQLQASVQALVTGWSAYAHAPYAASLERYVDFDERVREDLENLLAGAQRRRVTRGRTPPPSRRARSTASGRTRSAR